MLKRIALVASLMAVAQAFLLPPSVSSADIHTVESLPIESLATIDSGVTVNLQCTTCPVAVNHKGRKTAWVKGVNSHLQLKFSVTHGESDVLSMNGAQIYPPRFDKAPEPLTALQVAEGTSPSDATNQHLRLGYEFFFRPEKAEQSGDDALQLLDMHFQIVEIGDKFVDGLESVQLKVLKTSSGKLMIANIATAATSNIPIDPSKAGADCTTLTCKFRAIIAGELSHVKPKKGGCGSKAGSVQTVHSGRFRHGHRHRRSGFGHFLRVLRSFALHVLIPVSVGVAVGMTASIVGMIAGQMIVFFWRAIYRNGQGSYSQVNQDEAEEEHDGETKSFLENQAVPSVSDRFLKDEKTAQ